jgi:hypothetical protein
VWVKVGADFVDRDVAHRRQGRDWFGVTRAPASLILNDGERMTQCVKSGGSKMEETETS